MADGRFETALNCMTEDARNEWLGEMLIGCLFNPEAEDFDNTGVRFSADEVLVMRQSTDKNREVLLGRLSPKAAEIGDRTIGSDTRRRLAIEAGKLDGAIGAKVYANLIVKFLSGRIENEPGAFNQAAFGEIEEVPDRTKPDKGAKKYRLQPASPDQQPLELDIIQIDGLWKLNSIIDPALKPWPLPTEEPTPPAEATPVDGATGVP